MKVRLFLLFLLFCLLTFVYGPIIAADLYPEIRPPGIPTVIDTSKNLKVKKDLSCYDLNGRFIVKCKK